MKLVFSDAREGLKAAISKVLSASLCRLGAASWCSWFTGGTMVQRAICLKPRHFSERGAERR